VVPDGFKFLGALGRTELCLLDVPEKLINAFGVPRLVKQPWYTVCIGCAKRACEQRDDILAFTKNLGVVEIIPCRLHHLSEQGIPLRDVNGMLDLPQKLPPFLAVCVFDSNNEVVCFEAIYLALKFYFYNRPRRQTWRVTASEHQSYKRCLHMGFKMNSAASGGERIT